MASFNRVMLLGNLTRDPQLKFLPSQTPVAEFGLAMNRKFRTQQGEDREEVTFVDCSAFGRQAEIINQYCTKGKQIFIEGRLKLDTWEDKQGGGKRSKLSVVVENFTLLGGREGGGGGQRGGDQQTGHDAAYDDVPQGIPEAPRGRQPSRPAPAAAPPASSGAFGDDHFEKDDIPF